MDHSMRGWMRLLVLLLLTAFVAAPAMSMFLATPVMAQDDDDGGDDDDDGGDDDGADDGADGGTTIVGEIPGAGIVIDADGVLRMKQVAGQLTRQRRLQARAALNPDLAKVSKLRKISLNRLEAAVADQLAAGAEPTDDMKYLAGMTQIEYVFFYPESKDIVIAGPAEGFMLDGQSRPVGIASGESVLQLEDLIVALRAFGPGAPKMGSVGVSIDPTPEGLARMQQFLANFGRRVVPSDTRRIIQGLKDSLGRQVVSVRGISPNTHFATVLVEADYRMKLIGIGLETPPVKITSYVRRANPSTVSRNALQRWYFIPDYESVRVSDDGYAMQLIGEGVKLVNANELVRGDGTRVNSAKPDRASRTFVESFTRRYPELARKVPVYAQLRNLVDVLIAAAYIQEQDFYSQAEWDMKIFGNEAIMPVEIYAAPKEVETAVNAVWKGNVLMTPVGGGVHIDARKAISVEHVQPDEEGAVADKRETVTLDGLADGQWWWD